MATVVLPWIANLWFYKLGTYVLQMSCRELLLAGKLHNNSGELRKGPDLFDVIRTNPKSVQRTTPLDNMDVNVELGFSASHNFTTAALALL